MIKTAGEFRTEIYAELQSAIGKELSPEQHDKVRGILIEYVATNSMAIPVKHEHTFICGNCGGKKQGKGSNFKKTMQKKYETTADKPRDN